MQPLLQLLLLQLAPQLQTQLLLPRKLRKPRKLKKLRRLTTQLLLQLQQRINFVSFRNGRGDPAIFISSDSPPKSTPSKIGMAWSGNPKSR
jgi:hypothetical protein